MSKELAEVVRIIGPMILVLLGFFGSLAGADKAAPAVYALAIVMAIASNAPLVR